MKEESDYYFHRSIRKHGWDNFDYEVLEENVDDLNVRENYYMNTLNTIWPNGYNQCEANSLDHTAIEKMRETKKKQYASMTDEERRKCVDAMVKANTGRKHSEETKKKMSESAKRHLSKKPRIRSEETKKKTSEAVKKARAAKFWSTKKINSTEVIRDDDRYTINESARKHKFSTSNKIYIHHT